MRRTLAMLSLVLIPGPVLAAEPIRLQVIPFQAGWGSKKLPVHNFKGTLVPPPAVIPPAVQNRRVNRKRRPKSGRDADWEWLMD